jgi:hypothetical protein
MTSPDLFARPEPVRRGTRLPSDWKPTLEAAKFARDLGLDVGAVADTFRDYWISRAGAGGVKLDWLATWRNWCRETKTRNARRNWQQLRKGGPIEPPPVDEWWPRLRTYKAGGWWSPMWGPRPESGQSFVPKDILARWKNGGE